MLNILTNTASMAASRTLNQNQKALAQSFQRLSTGLRINSSKDDAAGLAISNRLSAQLRGLTQASRNANDGISMLQTADSALSEQQTMLQRLRELAVQASSDTADSAVRSAIQTEASALVAEIDRIATTTNYNGKKLLDGSFSAAKLQIGANSGDTFELSFNRAASRDLGKVVQHTTSSAVTNAAWAADALTINGTSVRVTTAADDTVSTAGNVYSAIAKAAAINDGTGTHGVTAKANATVLVASAAVAAGATAAGFAINGVTVGEVTTDANDASGALVGAINAVSSQTGVSASNSGGVLTLTAVDGRNIAVTGGGAALDIAAEGRGSLTLQADEAFYVGGAGVVTVAIDAAAVFSTNRATNASNLNFGTQAGSSTAIEVLDDALNQIASRQASVGALLNRMDSTVSNLSTAAENVAAARARIVETDFAAETAAFTKQQILQQASAVMLAQANVSSQVVLSLLS